MKDRRLSTNAANVQTSALGFRSVALDHAYPTCQVSIGAGHIAPYIRAMMKATIRSLFELLMGPTVQTESEMARLLGVDLMALRARLVDLRKRGIVSGPVEDGSTTRWKSWFPTVLATTEASERSGLHASAAVAMRRSWWNGIWANE